MRLFSVLNLVVILAMLLLSAAPSQAQIQIGNGTLTATATSPPDNSDTPSPILLSSTNTTGSLSASSTSTDGYYITGSISANVSLGSTSFAYSFTGESGDNFINRTLALGTSTLDVFFTLSAPSVIELSAYIGNSAPNDYGATYSYGTAALLNSSNSVLASIGGGYAGFTEPSPVYESLPAGTYQLQAELNSTYSAGTGGPAAGNIDMSLTPEPASALLIAPLILATRRRRARNYKRHLILTAASSLQSSPSSAHKDYSPPLPASP
jgi:hypothetical protein